ncbi:DUF1254 domain-containing protein [Parvibaculum sp.]|uniref:DUF1254 domain-containing protein n=1 Tax=Parvibaculum sp. TaxID=2024848 RepID=UPI0032971269
MNRLALMGAAALATAVAVHVAVVAAVPHIVMGIAMARIAGDGGANVMKDAPPPTAEARTVVRPSPDLAYSACVLDLARGPVRLSVRKSAPYTSLSLFAANTDNYFIEDDRRRDGEIELIVVGPGGSVPPRLPQGARVVEAPSDRGMAIVRRVVEQESVFSGIEAARRRSFCVPYPG